MTRVLWLLACTTVGGVGAYYAQPYTSHNADVVLIIVITIIGDPIMIQEGSWRVAEGGHDTMRHRLFSHIALFLLYLITIAVLFVGAILDKALDSHSISKSIVEWIYLFLGITSFLLTFALPVSLWNMQKARYEAEIERRRKQTGIQPQS